MKAVIQRVNSASVTVTVNNQIISSIQRGLLVLIGIQRNDTKQHCEYIARKVLNLRIFPSLTQADSKPWDSSVMDVNGDVLFVSQFTLHAILKGNKLDYHNAMSGSDAETLYNEFLNIARNIYKTKSNDTKIY